MGMKFKEFAWEGCGSGSEQVNVLDNSINKHTANITALVIHSSLVIIHSSSNMALTNIKLCDKGTSLEF